MSNKYWVWLSSIDNLSLDTIYKLLKIFKEPERIWYLDKKDLEKINLNKEDIDRILNIYYKQNLDNIMYYIKKNNIITVSINDENYPNSLKNIYDPPILLYLKGNIDLIYKKSISIIGCRLCSSYGKVVTKKFAYNLAKKNITIISGLARGIDTYAHIGALEANGNTIAVLGSGIDVIYPKENENLYNSIIKNNGLIISEYIIGTKPIPINFPKRNRIISALSSGVLVTEAKIRSGSFITVDFALEQGKEIFAVPGNINSVNSEGTNYLIKQGAKLVTSVDDILDELIL